METGSNILSLAGKWQFKLDPDNQGIQQHWFDAKLPQNIALPGTTDEAGYGEGTNEACADRLSRVYRFIGPAWYQREVTIPANWQDKIIYLTLERTKNSQVWIDGKWAGSDESLSTPHEFDLSKHLTPGKHTLTILIDNAKLPPVGPCHQVDERTQTNWNGILGNISLRATERIHFTNLQAYPDPAARTIRIAAKLVNETPWSGAANLTWKVEVVGQKSTSRIPPAHTGTLLNQGTATLGTTIKLPETIPMWDEFDTTLLRITAELEAMPVATPVRDACNIICGLRNFSTNRGQFTVNGRPTILRGRVDSAIFPLTGYAPMDKQEWMRLLSIAKSYGLNHYRFHSWCPPEAAFAAADELGFYFLAELPNKREITAPDNKDYRPPAEAYETLAELEGDGGPPAIRTAYLLREGERILKHYGNHPSFVMLTLGNELGGDESVMKGMCDHFRAIDDRHLYAMGSGHFHWDLGLREGDQFWVTRSTGKNLPMRGASFESHGHIDHKAPSTTVDYDASLQGVPVPVISHENAEFEVYPDYREIKKYKGVLRARNFEIFRERLKAAGMLDQAMDFFKASGALSVICHREDVEACMRTSGIGGFHLLDLMDFSGQGTALVGILDAFMDSKGLITPDAWRQFCCETVPLLWMTKYTWTNDETFHGRIRIAHYGPNDFIQKHLTWTITADKKVLAKGQTRTMDILTGNVSDVDLFSADLSGIKTAQKLLVTIAVPGTPYKNTYDIWVYPQTTKAPAAPKGITVTRSLNRKVQTDLESGKTILFFTKPGTVKQTVRMAFQTGFWSPMFRMGNKKAPDGTEVPGTQGILLDPKHPLFKDFPTEFHSNWQWWQLVKHCDPMILNDTPQAFRPIVQVIDGIDRNYKLGLILEAKVGHGRLIVCTIDLLGLQQHPEARQLLKCLYAYASSSAHKPIQELDPVTLRAILP
ncbi:MAG: sugar-binding domain-containing protein [Kiritimatiellia bacterium]